RVSTSPTRQQDALHRALTMHRIADFVDRHTRNGRFRQFVGQGGRVVPQSLCAAAGALMPVLEFVPFSSSILGAAVLCFSVSLLTRDGLFVVFGMAIMAVVAIIPVFVLT
ncbi:MAG: exopolysaccharide biosynthesis protein, partial [Hyphomicrobiales bacterium]